MFSIQEKFCLRCRVTKPVSDYTNNKRRADGLALYCRNCESERGKEYRKNNSELVRSQDRAYYARNKEVVAEKHRLWWIERKKRGPVPHYHSTPEQKRNNAIKHLYGITIDDYYEMVKFQDGKCGLCGKEKKLVIDHDHDTGKVRGLLCRGCNAGFAAMGDNESAIGRIARYLNMNL